MTSVRLRLLILALAPLVVLMPLLMLMGMSRWTADYDKVLIANVESDLRIAEQYLTRIMAGTGNDLTSIARADAFSRALNTSPDTLASFLDTQREALRLDFLYFRTVAELDTGQSWPVIANAVAGSADTQVDIFDTTQLAALDSALAEQARIDLIETEAAVPTNRTIEDRGMVVHSAAPVQFDGIQGVLVGGILLNRNLDFIDTINALVYLNATTGGDRQGTATLFLEDVRVSTNVRLFEDVRALGTRVSAVVRQTVLDEGLTWLDRAFVVNDWYISGYLPIVDSFGERVGMLYVGFLEAPFSAAKRAAFWWMFGAFAAVLLISAPLFFLLAKGIFAPLERMTKTMTRVGNGDFAARNGEVRTSDEIAQVATHMDNLLDQVQDRDRALRDWANELNARVEDRTAELRTTNEKLQTTYKQLVLSEKLAAIGEITAGVAHEINNPIAVIQGNVDVIRDTMGHEAETMTTELDLIDQQVGRISGMVGKLLQFARPSEYAGFDGTVDMKNVVEDCFVLVEHVLSSRDLQKEIDLSDTARVRIDPGEMQQVIVNLVVNAAQAMGQHGTLGVCLKSAHRNNCIGICLEISDTGPGIPQDKLTSVFDPFFTTKQGEGTGLGLSISQTLIQQAGGIISAQNRRETGAVFSVWLPEANDADLAAE